MKKSRDRRIYLFLKQCIENIGLFILFHDRVLQHRLQFLVGFQYRNELFHILFYRFEISLLLCQINQGLCVSRCNFEFRHDLSVSFLPISSTSHLLANRLPTPLAFARLQTPFPTPCAQFREKAKILDSLLRQAPAFSDHQSPSSLVQPISHLRPAQRLLHLPRFGLSIPSPLSG